MQSSRDREEKFQEEFAEELTMIKKSPTTTALENLSLLRSVAMSANVDNVVHEDMHALPDRCVKLCRSGERMPRHGQSGDRRFGARGRF